MILIKVFCKTYEGARKALWGMLCNWVEVAKIN
jgi:hypothetical protein